MRIEQGATRIAFIFKRYVVKIPTFKEWKLFLNGILANLSERQWNGFHRDFAKVYVSSRFGLWLVMEYIRPLGNDVDWGNFKEYIHYVYQDDDIFNFITSDCKPNNWGIKDDRLVKIDYA